MREPRRLDDLLADAEVLIDRAGDEELAASRRRIEAEFAASRHTAGLAGGAPPPRPAQASLAAFLDRRARRGAAPHEQAARDLRELSALVITGAHAVDHIAQLATSRQINPDGALTFACLLHLADREDGAEFLWQFSAGAGKTASAACLYLLHLKRGDVRDAHHWAGQALALESQEAKPQRKRKNRSKDRISTRRRHRDTPAARIPNAVPDDVMLLHTLHALQPPQGVQEMSVEAFHLRTGALSYSLTQAVQRLHSENDPELGAITWPDQHLAEQLQRALPA
ncbi:hypothetical protein [Actinacidiphila glaucinigra]|uniref:Uncharacterized protein n=1 Tax=Actinacidiphila glaucinigra TaxID=235986 RepID=A0A239NWB7_9ACTN|nr:hypothetical protein [Actinacidiphila glaucinigra]SNT58409.1 hypothetical protein SAMN05216252_1499 [Actinacidiphila glaucinigra]